MGDRASGNIRNNDGRIGRDGNEIWMGFNGKGMEWNMVHDKNELYLKRKKHTLGLACI